MTGEEVSCSIYVSDSKNSGSLGLGTSGGVSAYKKSEAQTQEKDSKTVENKQIFKDIDGHWANKTIAAMYEKGIAKGDGYYFYPDRPITRAETAALVARVAGVDSELPKDGYFSDVFLSDWYYNNINVLYEKNIFMGSSGKVYPSDSITREELICIVIRTLQYKKGNYDINGGGNFEDFSDISDWARDSVKKAEALKLTEGSDNRFNPKSFATRAETLTVIERLLQLLG